MKLKTELWYKVLAPRPAVLVSTVSKKGISNVAPFSFVMPASMEPPILAFASDPEHDTVRNIKETKDFVVNIPSKKILKNLWICAEEFDYGVSEFEKASLTEEKSQKVKSPRVKECIAFFECKLRDLIETGDHVLILGEVLVAEVKDEFYKKGYDIKKANPLLHIGGVKFTIPGEVLNAE